MLNLFAYALAALLGGIAFLHLTWALGSPWPCRDQATLARTVVGTRGIERMPSAAATLVVALALAAAALWPILLREVGPVRPPRDVVLAGGVVLSMVFALRGALGVLPSFERAAPEQPFMRLNRLYYSPLCLAIGLGFALLVAAWPNWAFRFGLID